MTVGDLEALVGNDVVYTDALGPNPKDDPTYKDDCLCIVDVEETLGDHGYDYDRGADEYYVHL